MQISRLLGYGFESNVYLLNSGKKALIDTGTGRYTSSLLKELKKLILLDDISYIILTHEHFDHVGGAIEIKKATGATIVTHKVTSKILEQGLSLNNSFFNARIDPIYVDHIVNEDDQIDFGDTILKILHTPGHSKGSICLYEPVTASLFSGDTVFSLGDVGRTDFPGGNSTELKSSIQKLQKIKVTNLYPGHGDYVLLDGSYHIDLAFNNICLL